MVGQVPGDLATGSGRREGPGKTDDQDVLAREALVERDLFRGEPVVQVEALRDGFVSWLY